MRLDELRNRCLHHVIKLNHVILKISIALLSESYKKAQIRKKAEKFRIIDGGELIYIANNGKVSS